MSKKIRKTTLDVQTSVATIDAGAQQGVTSAEKESPADVLQRLGLPDDPGLRSVIEHGIWRNNEDAAVRFAAVLEDLDTVGWDAPKWLEDMPSEEARNEADKCLGTDIWPRRDDAQALADALWALCHSGAAGRLFGESLPTIMLRNPRIGFVSRARYTLPRDKGRWVCSLTGETFELPEGAPVPALLCDAYEVDGEYNAEQENPYDRNPEVRVIHPSLLMAGRSFVMWAVWSRIRDLISLDLENMNVAERLGEAVELLTIVAGAGPANVGVEDPATAYLAWERTEDGYDRKASGWVHVPRHLIRAEG